MAIYNIFDYVEEEEEETPPEKPWHNAKIDPEQFTQEKAPAKERFFSAFAARFFFFLLLIADVLWGIYCSVMCLCKLCINCLTLFRVRSLRQRLHTSWINLRRSIVCGIALMVALFSPALGIMFSCMYFLMYDRSGVEEVVPTSLQEQFQQIFKQ